MEEALPPLQLPRDSGATMQMIVQAIAISRNAACLMFFTDAYCRHSPASVGSRWRENGRRRGNKVSLVTFCHRQSVPSRLQVPCESDAQTEGAWTPDHQSHRLNSSSHMGSSTEPHCVPYMTFAKASHRSIRHTIHTDMLDVQPNTGCPDAVCFVAGLQGHRNEVFVLLTYFGIDVSLARLRSVFVKAFDDGVIVMEDLLEPAFAEIDTDSFEVLTAHPFCRGLRKEAACQNRTLLMTYAARVFVCLM